MKRIVVTDVVSMNGEFFENSIRMVAELKNKELSVIGVYPGTLIKSLGPIDVVGLEAKEAEDLFYLIAAARQPDYTNVELQGLDEDDVQDYLEDNFDPRFVKFVTNGLPAPRPRQ